MTEFPHPSEQVIVYHYKPNSKSAFGVVTGRQLELAAKKYTTYRLTKKPVPIGAMLIDVFGRDMWTPEEKVEMKDLPNGTLHVATIRLPADIVARRLVGRFKEMWILFGISVEGGKASGKEGSVEGGKKDGEEVGEEVGEGSAKAADVDYSVALA